MRILVTAGNTLVPIDRVRGITNIFTGRTGTRLALDALERGHAVLLLTSHPSRVEEMQGPTGIAHDRWQVRSYQTFDELQRALEEAIRPRDWDAVIHCAAVSDFRPAGIYAPAPGTRFAAEKACWEADGPAALVDRMAGKVKSDEPELWLRLVRTPKLIDRVRTDWGFRGVLVKFKLEVGITTERLREIAEASRQQSAADLMVANTLEGVEEWALLGPVGGGYQRVPRGDLPTRLLEAVERLHGERSHG